MRSDPPPLFDPVTPDDLVGDVLARSPARIAVFLARGMACPGCAMAGFMTVREAAQTYDLDLEPFVEALGEL